MPVASAHVLQEHPHWGAGLSIQRRGHSFDHVPPAQLLDHFGGGSSSSTAVFQSLVRSSRSASFLGVDISPHFLARPTATGFILATADPNLQHDGLHVDVEEIEDPAMPAPCERWQVSQGLHDLATLPKQLRVDRFPWLGGLADAPLAQMPKKDWYRLQKLADNFQDIHTKLTERMYMPYRGPCKLPVVIKDPETGKEEVQVDVDDPTMVGCIPRPKKKTKTKPGKRSLWNFGKKQHVEEQDEDENIKHFRELSEDPARFFATVPAKYTAKMKDYVKELRALADKDLPDPLDTDANAASPVDGATRIRYSMVMEQLRDLGTRTYRDMRRCRPENVRATATVLDEEEGSPAQDIRMGLQSNTMIYEDSLPPPRPARRKEESSCSVM